jgi:phosphoserine phosphatase
MSIPWASYEDVLERCSRVAQQGQRLRPDRIPIAALDADGTLWVGDVGDVLWQHVAARRALHPRRSAGPLARAVRALGGDPTQDPYADYATLERLHREGRCPEETLVRVMIQALAGLSEDQVRALAREAFGSVDALRHLERGRPARMIEHLRSLGFRVIVVSSSARWAVEVAVEPLGIGPDHVIGGQVSVVDSCLTDGIIEPLPYGKGKIQAILERFGAVPAVCFGNALADLAMLEAASHFKALVNPTEDLIRACEDVGGGAWSMATVDLHTSDTARVRLRRQKGAAVQAQSAGRPKRATT